MQLQVDVCRRGLVASCMHHATVRGASRTPLCKGGSSEGAVHGPCNSEGDPEDASMQPTSGPGPQSDPPSPDCCYVLLHQYMGSSALATTIASLPLQVCCSFDAILSLRAGGNAQRGPDADPWATEATLAREHKALRRAQDAERAFLRRAFEQVGYGEGNEVPHPRHSLEQVRGEQRGREEGQSCWPTVSSSSLLLPNQLCPDTNDIPLSSCRPFRRHSLLTPSSPSVITPLSSLFCRRRAWSRGAWN